MAGDEIQKPLFGGGITEELEVGFKPSDKRFFRVEGGLKRIDSFDVDFYRKNVKVEIIPVLDLENIKSVNVVPNSVIACRICVDQTEEIKNRDGIQRGIFRIGYRDGSFEMVCEVHRQPVIGDTSWQDRADIR